MYDFNIRWSVWLHPDYIDDKYYLKVSLQWGRLPGHQVIQGFTKLYFYYVATINKFIQIRFFSEQVPLSVT